MRVRSTREKGIAIVEALVAVGICLVIFLSVIAAFSLALQYGLSNTHKVQAAFLEEEGIEAVRILRDNGWSANIAPKATSTPFYLSYNGTTWVATTTNSYIDGVFSRSALLGGVYRDASKNIVSSGGTLDTNIRKLTVSVSWLDHEGTTTKSLSTYLTNIFNN